MSAKSNNNNNIERCDAGFLGASQRVRTKRISFLLLRARARALFACVKRRARQVKPAALSNSVFAVVIIARSRRLASAQWEPNGRLAVRLIALDCARAQSAMSAERALFAAKRLPHAPVAQH